MSWTTRPTMLALTRPTADDFDAINDQIDTLTSPAWTSYTPAWTSDGTPPALGNGTLTGAYRQPSGTDIIDVRFKFTRGTTSTNGTGSYFFSLPTVAAGEVGTVIGTWYMLDVGTQHYSGILLLTSATTVACVRDTNTVQAATPTVPATGDIIAGRMAYQPVS